MNRSNKFMILMLLFNIINFGIFMVYYLQFYFFTDDLGKYSILLILKANMSKYSMDQGY